MVPTSRVLADHRVLVSVLALLGIVNLVGLGMVIGPIRSRVQTLTQRSTVASLAAATAARDLADARQTSAGTEQAVADLQRFHSGVLPASQAAARQVTFVRLAQLAREADLSYDHRAFEQEGPDKDGVLTRATLTLSVFGSYRNLRRFLYTLETGPDFVVIQEVGVMQSDDPSEPLEAALTLSTYFRARDDR